MVPKALKSVCGVRTGTKKNAKKIGCSGGFDSCHMACIEIMLL